MTDCNGLSREFHTYWSVVLLLTPDVCRFHIHRTVGNVVTPPWQPHVTMIVKCRFSQVAPTGYGDRATSSNSCLQPISKKNSNTRITSSVFYKTLSCLYFGWRNWVSPPYASPPTLWKANASRSLTSITAPALSAND